MHAYTQVHFSEGLKGLLGGGLVCRGSTLAGPHRLLRLLSNEELSRALPCTLMGFPHDADGKKSAYNAKATNASRVRSLGQEDPTCPVQLSRCATSTVLPGHLCSQRHKKSHHNEKPVLGKKE